MVRYKEKNEKKIERITHYRQIENETDIYWQLNKHSSTHSIIVCILRYTVIRYV
ncbi:hypothetical protein NEAUS03_0793 [Nematocida ausubeli]|nr:hypothetical protein NEAUS03_0793 [Nematocida ausubeli]